jgi:hypothetical protein
VLRFSNYAVVTLVPALQSLASQDEGLFTDNHPKRLPAARHARIHLAQTLELRSAMGGLLLDPESLGSGPFVDPGAEEDAEQCPDDAENRDTKNHARRLRLVREMSAGFRKGVQDVANW